MMSNEGEKKCPLCAEEMDWTDQQLKPCKCGYEVCVWCWHHIMDMAEKDETEGRCPACRTPYDKEKIVGMEAKCERLVSKKDRETKPQKPKPKKQEERKDLTNVRVIQRKMAYVIGLPLSLADEDVLQRKEYFGQYGKVCKVSLSRTAGGAIQQFVNDTCSVYITYSKEEESIRCIQSVHGFVLEGRSLRASFGTAKYCHAWLKNVPCNNPACLYLHSIGAEEDSFGKDEEAAVHTRNRVHQIVGATHNMQRRSGTTLPPPLDETFYSSSVAKKELTSNGPLTCSMSSKDQDGRVKTPNRSFLDVVAQSSSGPELGNVTEDRKPISLCSEFSSLPMNTDFCETEYSNAMPAKVSSISQLSIAVPDKDSQHYTVNSFMEHENYHLPVAVPAKDLQHYASNSFRDPVNFSLSGITDYTKQQSYSVADSSHCNLGEGLSFSDGQVSVPAATCPVKYSVSSDGHVLHLKEVSNLRVMNADSRNLNNCANEASMPFRSVNSTSANGFTRSNLQSHPNLNRILRSSSSLSNEEIVGQLRRLDGDNITNGCDSSALDAVESNIISSILSLDFDACDDSLALPHSLAEIYSGSDGRHVPFKNPSKSDRSRFSFAKEDGYLKESTDINSSFSYINQSPKKYSLFSGYMGNNSLEKENRLLSEPQINGSKTLSLAPPGFSVPTRDPPPGFACERTNQLYPASGSYMVSGVSLPNNQYSTPSNGNIRSASDFDFNDPAILVVRGGKSSNEVNNIGSDSWQTSNPQHITYDDETRLWLLMQQGGVSRQNAKVSPTYMQDLPPVQQDSRFVANGEKYSAMGNSFGVNSKITEQSQTYDNQSSFAQYSQQKYGNGHMSNGHWSNRDEGVPEVERNDRLGFDKYFSGHRDIMFQMSSTGDVYNRVYGL